jgi:zinc transporter ZupT
MLTFAIIASLSTFLGGLFALRYKDHLHLLLGFTAGVLLSVVAFDLLPEIFELATDLSVDPIKPMIALVAGFLLFHIFEKIFAFNHSHEEDYGEHRHPVVGMASASALVGHSFLDGIAIGLAFLVSPEIGVAVSLAIIAHDFTDGLNTVSLLVLYKNTRTRILGFLAASASAPILGALSTKLISISQETLLWYLGFFAGFLLYIGTSEILPEAHSKHSSWKTVAMTILGVLLFYLAIQVIEH